MKVVTLAAFAAVAALSITAKADGDDDFFAQLVGENDAASAPAAETPAAGSEAPADAAAAGADAASSPAPENSPFGEEMRNDLKEVLGEKFEEAAVAAGEENKRLYFVIPECSLIENGKAEVLLPGAKEWQEMKELSHYPLGSFFRTVGRNTKLTMTFGLGVTVKIIGEASFGTLAQPLGVKSRTVVLSSGVITVSVPSTMPRGLFVVSAPGFKAVNLTGVSRYSYKMLGDGDEATIRCVTGFMDIEGRHFRAEKVKTASVVRIRTSLDCLLTSIFGIRGDVDVRLDQGRFVVKDLESGEDKVEDRYLDWKLSPETAVRIYRAVPSIGANMSVSILTFNESGHMKNRCAFTEGRFEINTGELGPTSKKDREELARKAAQATETVTVEMAAPAAAPAAQPAEAAPAAESAPAVAPDAGNADIDDLGL